MFKKLAFLLIVGSLLTASTGVSYGQDQPPGKVQQITIEKQLPSAVIVPTITHYETLTIKPEREVIAFADADYGNYCIKQIYYTLNLYPILNQSKNNLVAIKPLTHSSGGLPFRRC
ncbi:MAG: hypothetical protein U0T69_11360 [Chitinophagales bacterium]